MGFVTNFKLQGLNHKHSNLNDLKSYNQIHVYFYHIKRHNKKTWWSRVVAEWVLQMYLNPLIFADSFAFFTP